MIDPKIPILQISDIRFFLFLIKILPQVIKYKVDIIEYKKTWVINKNFLNVKKYN